MSPCWWTFHSLRLLIQPAQDLGRQPAGALLGGASQNERHRVRRRESPPNLQWQHSMPQQCPIGTTKTALGGCIRESPCVQLEFLIPAMHSCPTVSRKMLPTHPQVCCAAAAGCCVRARQPQRRHACRQGSLTGEVVHRCCKCFGSSPSTAPGKLVRACPHVKMRRRTCRIPLLQDAFHLGCLINAVILRAEEPYFVIGVDGSLLRFARASFHISVQAAAAGMVLDQLQQCRAKAFWRRIQALCGCDAPETE